MNRTNENSVTKRSRQAARKSLRAVGEIERSSIVSFCLCCFLILLVAGAIQLFQWSMANDVQDILSVGDILDKADNSSREISVVASRLRQGNFTGEAVELKEELRNLVRKLENEVSALRASLPILLRLKNLNRNDTQILEKLLYELRLFNKTANIVIVEANPLSLSKDNKDKLEFLAIHGHKGLSDTLNSVEASIDFTIKEIRTRRDRMGHFLFVISILALIGIWYLSFRPVLNLIRKQHIDLESALLNVESAQRTQSNFLANISHEIRTPMTAILGYSELLNRKVSGQDSEVAETVGVVHRNAEHLLSLLDDILALSKIDAGRFLIEKSKIDFQQLLNEVHSLFLAKAQEKGTNLSLNNEGEIPQYLFTDPVRLKQVLLNIVGNAVKFTDQGSVQISVYCRNTSADKHMVFIDVSDTGIGIRHKDQEKLFEYFSQVDDSSQRNFGGTGLGLVLSRNLARLLGGDVKLLSSNYGMGSTFQVSIDPGKLSKSDFIRKLRGGIRDETGSLDLRNKQDQRLQGLRILVIDDAIENARLFKIYLEEYGASVDAYNSGHEALDAVRAAGVDNYDVALLDLQMPGLDGFQVIRKLKDDLGFTKPVLALTAHGLAHEKAATKRAGFAGHLTKPISSEDLVNAILTNVIDA